MSRLELLTSIILTLIVVGAVYMNIYKSITLGLGLGVLYLLWRSE